jgi:signal peptidase I
MGAGRLTAALALRGALLVALPLVVLAIWFVAFRPAELGGPVRYAVIHGQSMEPTLHAGDLIVTRTRGEYEIGDVIAFESPVGAVTHRIVGGDAEEGYISEGDNNQRPDPWVITPEQITGKVWFSTPYGSHLSWLGPATLSLSSAFFGILALGYLRRRTVSRA